MIAVHRRDPVAYEALERALDAPSLYDEVLRLLSRRGYGIPDDYLTRDFREPYRASKEVAGAWLGVYHNAEKDWDLYELAERLVDLDHNFQLWRCHHLKTVERIIGYKPGTGGTRRSVLPGEGAGAQVLSGAVADPDVDVARRLRAPRRRDRTQR